MLSYTLVSTDNESTRLNKYLALHAGISRREADEFVLRGRVTVNGKTAVNGMQVSPSDTVSLDDKPLSKTTELIYVMLNKPVGYVCSRRAQGENQTIYDLLPTKYHSLKSVGRLDRDSSGLIMMTNDGDFAHHMTHPSFSKVKIYDVTLDKTLEPLHQQMIGDIGINLDDGKSQLGLECMSDDRLQWRITMSEGRNRQIRRTFSALGYTVSKLHRTNFGPYTLGNLAPGKIESVQKL